MKPSCLFGALRPSPATLPARRNDAMAVSLRMLAAVSFLLLSASGGWAQMHQLLTCEDPGKCKAVGCGRDYQEAHQACARACLRQCSNCLSGRYDFQRWSFDLNVSRDEASSCPIAETPTQLRWDAASHAERKKWVQENRGIRNELVHRQRMEFDFIEVELQREAGEAVCQGRWGISCQEAVRRGLN
jgi:hypothetical protein